MELLDNLLPAIVIVVVIYVPVIVLAVVSLRRGDVLSRSFLLRQRRRSLAALVAGAACMAGSYLAGRDYSARLHLYPLNVFYNIYLAADRYKATADYPQTSAGFRFNAVPTMPPQGARSMCWLSERRRVPAASGFTAMAATPRPCFSAPADSRCSAMP